MADNKPRPKPNVGTGQQKVDTEVEAKLTSANLIPTPLTPEQTIQLAAADPMDGGKPIDESDIAKRLAVVQAELEFRRQQVKDIELIIDNPWHVVGYLVSLDPIEKIVKRKFTDA